jgi:hypothetical protein
MAWDVVMFGSLSVPERNVEEWLTSTVGPDDLPWLDEVGGNDVLHQTPEALLGFLRDVTVAPHELFQVSLADGRVTVDCYVSEDAYRETSQALALLFASSAPFGGVGELTFYGYQGIRFGERLRLAGGTCTFHALTQDELGAVERLPAFVALDTRIHARFDALLGREAAPLDPRRSRLIIHPFTGRQVRVADDGTLAR